MKKVCIIGAGAAGLSAAVFLKHLDKNNDFKITIYEASPKCGGRAYSFFDKKSGRILDNGQHILASWYNDTFEFLKIIGSMSTVKFQNQLSVNFIDENGSFYKFRCPKLPTPMNLITGIFNYKALKWKDKIALLRLIRGIRKDSFLDENTDILFERYKQTKRLVQYFWDPFIKAVFNSSKEKVSAKLFANMIRTGFLKKGGSKLVLPDVNLNRMYVEPALKYLISKDTVVQTSIRVMEITSKDDIVELNTDKGKTESFDYVISAASFYDYEGLVINKQQNKTKLDFSSILNMHIIFEKDTNHDEMFVNNFLGMVNSPVHWIFKTAKDQLCLVKSNADEFKETDAEHSPNKNKIQELFLKELYRIMPRLESNSIKSISIIKEKRATFIPDNISQKNRPENKTKFKNFFIAGDWTNTGYPATIESAVTSGRKCVELIYSQN